MMSGESRLSTYEAWASYFLTAKCSLNLVKYLPAMSARGLLFVGNFDPGHPLYLIQLVLRRESKSMVRWFPPSELIPEILNKRLLKLVGVHEFLSCDVNYQAVERQHCLG